MASATFLEKDLDDEDEHEVFNRIVFKPDLLGGKPVIKGTRLSVEFILERLACYGTVVDVLREFPHLTDADVREAILFAAANLKNDIFLAPDSP